MVQLATLAGSYIKTRWDATFIKNRRHLQRVQKRRLQRLLNWLPAGNYYARYKNQPWNTIPYSDKSVWMGNFNRINTLGLDFDQARDFARHQENTRDFSEEIKPGVSVGLSSGTSGNQGVFVTTQREQSLWAGAVLGKLLPGLPKGHQKIAFFMRANNNLYESTSSAKLTFKFFDLMAPMAENLAALRDFEATVLVGPPAMLLEIVRYYQDQNLELPFKKIISVAETLEPEDQDWLSQATNQPIHQVYQATEGFLATTCAYGTLHMNEDNLLVEKDVLDEEQRLFAPVITDFYRHSQPLIRYRLNDILQERATPCPCGSPYLALDRIIGREDDVLEFTTVGGDRRQVFPDFLRKVVLEADNQIQNYQILQKQDRSLQVALDDAAYQDAVAQSFADFFEKQGLEPLSVSFVPYHYDFKMGKRRKIVRER
ncbi:CoF synthetase [Lactobacillaceae bacterium L1_55_11]|nr:CoF synthetase [Lactobacillaceae bacterium L1_55_11]